MQLGARVDGTTYYQQVAASKSIGALKLDLAALHGGPIGAEAVLCHEGRPLPDDMICGELRPGTLLVLTHRQRGGAPRGAVSSCMTVMAWLS
jgi:hypothetical protein